MAGYYPTKCPKCGEKTKHEFLEDLPYDRTEEFVSCPKCNWVWDGEKIMEVEKQPANSYEKTLGLLTASRDAMQSEKSREDLTQTERECKVMLIDLCKEIAFEFAEGIEPIK